MLPTTTGARDAPRLALAPGDRSNTMQIETCCGSTIEPRHRQWVVCCAVKDFPCPSIAAWLGFDARLDDASNIYLCRGKVERYIGWIGAESSAAAFGVANQQENRDRKGTRLNSSH